MNWITLRSDDVGKLILRISIAAFILVYGFEKITNPATLTYIEELLAGIGLPPSPLTVSIWEK